jgi:putative glycosyltransferase (TIGR04372 family)
MVVRRLGRVARRYWSAARRRAIAPAVDLSYRLFRILPLRAGFAVLVCCESARLPARAALKAGFVPVFARRMLARPDFRLSSGFSRRFLLSSARVLYGIGAYVECCEAISASGRGLLSAHLTELWARSLFELGRFREARDALDVEDPFLVLAARPPLLQLKAHLDLILGAQSDARASLAAATHRRPASLCPHQNIAGRYTDAYKPTRLDVACGDDGRLFDAYNYIAQRVTHIGEGQLSADLYGRAFAAQKRLRSRPPALSPKLEALLRELDIAFDELRIIPVEWYTQIGHQGLLDRLFRMRDLGWWRGKAVFLMPSDLVANSAFQRVFERQGHVLIIGVNVDAEVARELFSLQRWCGMGFNAFEMPSGEIVPWQEAGAQMIRLWTRSGRGDPAREEFDRLYGDNEAIRDTIPRLRAKWGMRPDDWYVCLHLRDASHYGEMSGTGQTHRNAGVEGYLETLNYVTSQGGWVIKLGGPRSPKLPKMPGVFDYARSAYKSRLLDVHLIRNARYFIGTTSGLTDVAASLGTPCALVNCVSADAQMWGAGSRFALKRIRLRDGRDLTQRELTSAPWRWRAFGADVLARYGAVPVENTPEEVLETVKEVEAEQRGERERYESSFADADRLLGRWRASLALPYFYGAARPSLYWLDKNRSLLDGVATVKSAEPVSNPS